MVPRCADGDGVRGQFDVAERLLAGLDALDEVAVDAARRPCSSAPASAPASRPACLRLGGCPCRDGCDTGGCRWDSERSGTPCRLVVVIDDFLGLQLAAVDGEHRAAEVVRAPVGHAAAGIIGERPPAGAVDVEAAAAAIGIVGGPGRGAEPHVPVDACRDRLGRAGCTAARADRR